MYSYDEDPYGRIQIDVDACLIGIIRCLPIRICGFGDMHYTRIVLLELALRNHDSLPSLFGAFTLYYVLVL